jgi:hypothetical protein
VAQDIWFSARGQGFDSPRGYFRHFRRRHERTFHSSGRARAIPRSQPLVLLHHLRRSGLRNPHDARRRVEPDHRHVDPARRTALDHPHHPHRQPARARKRPPQVRRPPGRHRHRLRCRRPPHCSVSSGSHRVLSELLPVAGILRVLGNASPRIRRLYGNSCRIHLGARRPGRDRFAAVRLLHRHRSRLLNLHRCSDRPCDVRSRGPQRRCTWWVFSTGPSPS